VASRPSSSTGPTDGGGREPVAARVVEFTPRDRGLTTPANDNARPRGRWVRRALGPALLFVLAASGWAYLYLYLT
jgi:hypothetical protein